VAKTIACDLLLHLQGDKDAWHQLGQVKKYAKWVPGKRGFDIAVDSVRQSSLAHFQSGLESGWGVEELAAMTLDELPESSVARVLAVRHGMGHHNDLGGALSLFYRDSSLNCIGQEEAASAGDEMERVGIRKILDLIVVSPFTRTLETAAGLLGSYARVIPTII